MLINVIIGTNAYQIGHFLTESSLLYAFFAILKSISMNPRQLLSPIKHKLSWPYENNLVGVAHAADYLISSISEVSQSLSVNSPDES